MLSYSRRKARREKVLAKMARWREAKARKRIERMACEPPRVEWRGQHEHTITFHNRLTGKMHSLDLYRGQRRDSYDATVDGNPWRKGISATALVTVFRKKLCPHIARS